jgi:hypothetical protein
MDQVRVLQAQNRKATECTTRELKNLENELVSFHQKHRLGHQPQPTESVLNIFDTAIDINIHRLSVEKDHSPYSVDYPSPSCKEPLSNGLRIYPTAAGALP